MSCCFFQNGVESNGSYRKKIQEFLVDNTDIDNGRRFPVSSPLALQCTAKTAMRGAELETQAPKIAITREKYKAL